MLLNSEESTGAILCGSGLYSDSFGMTLKAQVSLKVSRGWKNYSEFKSTGCSFREPKFNIQHPRDVKQLSVTQVPKYQIPSSGFCRYQTYTKTYKQAKFP